MVVGWRGKFALCPKKKKRGGGGEGEAILAMKFGNARDVQGWQRYFVSIEV